MATRENVKTDYRKHPSYSTGYAAGIASRPRRGRSDAYDAGYDAGIDAANLFLANGFKRECGGFSISLGPITKALLVAQGMPSEGPRRECGSGASAPASPVPKECAQSQEPTP